MASRKGQARLEKDEFGELTIPGGALWGIGTARCLESFSITGRKAQPVLVDALVQVKKAVAITNGEMGLLDRKVSSAISQACDEILSGQWRDQFVVDAFSGGGGFALDVNVNEVLANRACEILGDPLEMPSTVKADKHVNLCQSTHDTYPTAMRVAILSYVKRLLTIILELERILRRKSLEFERVLKLGRTALRDSAPLTLGQEFNCFGSTVEHAERRIRDASVALEEVNLGGRAVGTGFNTMLEFSGIAVRNLSQITNLNLRSADDPFRLTQSMSDFAAFSSSLKEFAIDLGKICSDIRLMSSGPAAGFAEIKMPELMLQPSPVLPESMPKSAVPPLTEMISMVVYEVMGNDQAVALAAHSGQLESNTLTPLIIDSILSSMSTLDKSVEQFNRHCLSKITADIGHCKELLDKSGVIVAALTGELGHQKALDVVRQAQLEGADLKDMLMTTKLLPKQTLDKIFHYKFMTTPKSEQ